MKINFPSYFNSQKFKTLYIKNELFVDYIHELDSVKNVQLTIEQTFLVYLFEGEIKLSSSDGSTQYIKPNQGAIIPKGDYIMSEELSSSSCKFGAFLFFLSDDLLRNFCIENEIGMKDVENTEKAIYFIGESLMLQNYINSIILLGEEGNGKVSEGRVRLKAKELLYHLSENNPEQFKVIMSLSESCKYLELQRIVELNYKNKLSLTELAFLCGMSLSSFKRNFEKVYNSTPGKWIKKKRLKEASELLINSTLNVSEIGYEVGYSSDSHFVSAFKERYQLSPNNYRKSVLDV